MPTRLLLLLCLTGHVFAREPPDVDCLVVHLKYVHCSWDKQGTPEVNYTFYGWFHTEKSKEFIECLTYLSENNVNTGCNLPFKDSQRFSRFNTKLVHGNQTSQKEYDLKTKVKLNPPTSVTVRNGSDSNLWLKWSQIKSSCVESEVRYRVNNRKWATYHVRIGEQNYCVNLPSSSSRYELQVRSRLGEECGLSIFWSNWSEPVFWGSNNSTDTNQMASSTSVWTTVLYVVGAFILMLLVMMLLHHERIRIIFIPVVPKPSPNLHNIEDWFQFPKGHKESFNYNERPCLVREYCHVSQSDGEDCSAFSPENESDLSTSCSSSSSSSSSSSNSSTEEEMVSV
ncbi:cytokine receptor common subunit gamma-like [Pseudoliparis swirei]|uniref:cytokine receptor common subunit gamma-like n=1 Tax=Pseudoliparis swirei TaxID=2059687 RepID=UPI0024BDE531|nr:cytokine receptor common subunit gamma-like [Pseudoliparis swirei]